MVSKQLWIKSLNSVSALFTVLLKSIFNFYGIIRRDSFCWHYRSSKVAFSDSRTWWKRFFSSISWVIISTINLIPNHRLLQLKFDLSCLKYILSSTSSCWFITKECVKDCWNVSRWVKCRNCVNFSWLNWFENNTRHFLDPGPSTFYPRPSILDPRPSTKTYTQIEVQW